MTAWRALGLLLLTSLCAMPARGADEAALAAFIEQARVRAGVPGVAVSVIRNHTIAWSRGFGVANTLTQAPVTPDTPFPAASNAKPVAAWLVVQRAARGSIALHQPVLDQAAVHLPDTPRHRAITPWHLLTHTAGLGNFLRDSRRDVTDAPGTRFSYSGVGFMVLQELLEARAGVTLETEARNALFDPLGMHDTWFGERPPYAGSPAAPHVSPAWAAAPFGAVAATTFLLVTLLAAPWIRRRRGSWQIHPAIVTGAIAAPPVAAATLLWISGSLPVTAWFVGIPLAAAAPPFIVARLARVGVPAALAVAAVLVVAACVLLRDFRLPIPVDTTPNAATSLHASAPDLARFLIELARPTLGVTTATRAMTTAHQPVDDDSAWGLGIGVRPHAHGRDLWQWGSNPGAKSLMVMSPETGAGVVVLANAEVDGEFTHRIAARILGRTGCWAPDCMDRGHAHDR